MTGKREQELLERAARLLPAAARNPAMKAGAAMVIAEGHGSHITDTNGKQYIDYLLGSGPLLVGHGHPAVVEAVTGQLARGSSYLLISEPSIRLAERVVEAVPAAERVSFANSGTEAVLYALRLARAYRGRDKVLKFEGAYHGQSDVMLMSNQWTRQSSETPVANSLGIPAATAEEVLVAPFNDSERATEVIEANCGQLAAVIVEPMQRTIPPRDGFLEALRQATADKDIPLVFDETVTGFRLAWGGAQERYGVVPDLCVLGKSISAGHPLGVVCGRSDIMSFAEAGRQLTGDYVSITGTYSGNPVSAVAALAVLDVLSGAGVYEGLERRGRRLMEGLEASLRAAGIRATVSGEPSAFQPWFTAEEIIDHRSLLTADMELCDHFTVLLLAEGIMKAHEKFFVSVVHSDQDIEQTLAAFDAVAAQLAA